MRLVVVTALCGVLVAGCGDAGPAAAPPPVLTIPAAPPVYETDATLLQQASGPVYLCWVVLTSYPPQCKGLVVRGFDWSMVTGEESVSNTRWGGFRVRGTLAGDEFTLTAPPTPAVPVGDPIGSVSMSATFEPPCATLPAGWRTIDRRHSTFDAVQRASGRALSQRGYAGLWLFYVGKGKRKVTGITVRTSGDRTAMRHALRRVWGGALCVAAARTSEARLRSLQAALTAHPLSPVFGVHTSGPHDTVDVTVLLDDAATRRALAARVGGSGLVEVEQALLRPPASGVALVGGSAVERNALSWLVRRLGDDLPIREIAITKAALNPATLVGVRRIRVGLTASTGPAATVARWYAAVAAGAAVTILPHSTGRRVSEIELDGDRVVLFDRATAVGELQRPALETDPVRIEREIRDDARRAGLTIDAIRFIQPHEPAAIVTVRVATAADGRGAQLARFPHAARYEGLLLLVRTPGGKLVDAHGLAARDPGFLTR